MWVGVLGLLACWRNPHPIARVVLDWLPILVILAGYDLVRSFAGDLAPRATFRPQLDVDEFLFGGTTPTVWLQQRLVDRQTPHWWDYLVWLFYLSHFVVSLTIAAWCYVARRAWFRRYATLIVSVSALGFLTYFVFPAAPPWLASRAGYLPHTVRIVHSVWAALGLDGPARIFGGSTELANPVAALPSLHAAWPFLALLFFWNKAPRGRWVILVYNAVMVTVLVYGAEHYFSDVLLGWIYAVVVFVVVNRIFDYLDGRNAPRHLESKPGRATAASSTRS
jgi:hypothetical protein